MRNPQAFQQFQNLQKSQKDPRAFLNELTNNYTPDQMSKFRSYATSFGFTDDQLNKFGIKTNKS